MPPLVRDKLWLWGHDAGAHNEGWGLPRHSRITPAEAACYLGIPNLIMVRYQGRPALPFDQFAVPLRALRRVVWSVVGACGQTDEQERAHVLDLAGRQSNITGIMLDDFFGSEPAAGEASSPALPLEQLRALRSQLDVGGRRLSLWAVLYDHQLARPLGPYLDLLDVISFWTWDPVQLQALETNLQQLEEVAPTCDKVLGCYLWDYDKRRPMDLGRMRHQCAVGLDWLQQGRIQGIIFLASCICDLELEAVEWTREWIGHIGENQCSG